MPTDDMLQPQQQPPAISNNPGIPIVKAKTFDIAKLNFATFDELIKHSNSNTGLSFEWFVSNLTETQFGYLRVVNGKPVKLEPLLEVNIISVTPVKPNGLCADAYVVKYSLSTMTNITEKYISNKRLMEKGLPSYFSLSPPCSKKNADLCDPLIRHLILRKVNKLGSGEYIEVGDRPGWRPKANGSAVYECRDIYPEVLHPHLPKCILHCEKATIRAKNSEYRAYVQEKSEQFFKANIAMKALFLHRNTSYNSSFAHQCGSYFDLLPNAIPSGNNSTAMVAAVVQNNGVRSGGLLTLGENIRTLRERIAEINDTVLTVIDDTLLDEGKRRRTAISAIESAVLSHESGNRFVPVIISKYADQQILPDLRCPLALGDLNSNLEPSQISRLLEMKDAYFILEVEGHFREYFELYRQNHAIISFSVPPSIPACRRSAYICLITAARTYDQFMEPLFGQETEDFVEAWLSDVREESCSLGDELFRRFGSALNKEIASGRFCFIKRTKSITFEKGTDSVIVDDDYAYFETKIIKDLAINTMKLKSENTLMNMLLENGCLSVNDQHSRCNKIVIHDSAGQTDRVFTYGIAKELLNASNRRLLNLAGKYDYLLGKAEFEQHDLLPLGVIANGRYIGRGISLSSKRNEHIFITGRSGKGKTFFTHNLLPSLALLGGNSIVIDACGASTRDEVLCALPQEVVDIMFDFINVSPGQAKLPVNPLFIGDCTNLPEKKRRIVGFIKAAAGKLSKEDSRVIAGLISQRLQGHDEITVFTPEMLRKTLEKGGQAGRNAANFVESVLSDIEAIGCEEQGWGTFFAKHKRIPVILIDDAVGENVHELVDVLLNSLFEWQHDNADQPLTITVDEIKRMSFRDGSPLHTILTQGRRYRIRLIGITQDYISNDSHAIDVMKQAGTQVFFEPAKSHDRIAKELEYKDAADAGLSSMGIGECIVSGDLFNTKDGCNSRVVIPCSTLKFIDSPLYDRFLSDFGISNPQVNTAEHPDLSEVSQREGAENPTGKNMPASQILSDIPLPSSAADEMELTPFTKEEQSQPPDTNETEVLGNPSGR